jgi:hypothetical protein
VNRTTVLDRLFDLLYSYQSECAFNQYHDCDPQLGKQNAPDIRQKNLRIYLQAFARASYLLVGEAAGYAGCRFSGIPFTGEAQITGPERLPWTRGHAFEQSSLKDPWREHSAQIVWETLADRRDCVLWNAFPWHPHGDDPLSNRKPTSAELTAGQSVLRQVCQLFPHARPIAIGRVSERTLQKLDISATYVRHPAHGGKPRFVAGIQAIPLQKLSA